MHDTGELIQDFVRHFGTAEVVCYFSPGRINLIGEHIDYNGGYVLPAAISLGITAVVSRREDNTIRIYSKDFKEETTFDTDEIFPMEIGARNVLWPDYIKATLQVLKDKNVPLHGADILLSSDLPLGSGLSSSAAIECLTAYIFNEIFYTLDRKQLALDAQYAERNYIGVNCGIMDQFAVANGKKDHAILLNCTTLEYEFIPIHFRNYQLIIINSNKPRSLAASKYNERRAECDLAFSLLSLSDPAEDLCHVHEISLSFLDDDILYKRAKHAVLENNRVLHAVDALKRDDLSAFGQLLTESHISLDTDYEVSGMELNSIVHYSIHFDGCVGARMTGAGFGGCCIALVEKERVQKFISYVGKKYHEKTGLKADFYPAEMSDGVRRIMIEL